ncbi:protein turtle [Phlebotomus argentipes]|uniref:protein turtle n=1 Tax=Phlebotomus argentipes TaxID=94469 RepID=UPI0028930745|nr:protein turtle [Phlebotomus argentipes]
MPHKAEMTIVIQISLLLMVICNFRGGGCVKDVPQYSTEAVVGETLHLHCNVSTNPDTDDDVVLVLWYRQDKGTPIYSVDIRDQNFKGAKRWSDDGVFGNRAHFMFDKDFDHFLGELTVQDAKESDAGLYRCRVDFKIAQTRNSMVNLTIIAPPDRIAIKDEADVERASVVGPYAEGDYVKLKCEVFGGRPPPKINWYRDGKHMMSDIQSSASGRNKMSIITFGPLARQDLNSVVSCRASNHPRAAHKEVTVQIDMNFAPLNVKLLGTHQPLSEGRRYDLLCQSSGSRPPAVITWWLDSKRLEQSTEMTSSNGNQTTSTLSIVFNRNDSSKFLCCRAYNHVVSSKSLEDGWKLDIQYIPETKIRLGTSLDSNSIYEGTDLYFDCLISAKPAVYRVEWRHNGRTLPHNQQQGIIISNQSLVLQGVSRSTAGNYSCVGFNAEGEGVSSPFELNVLYAPSCAPNQTRIYGVAKQENAQIKCTVEANPPEVEFRWTFNNSAESIDVAGGHVSRFGTSSSVLYTPMTELDYGTLMCQATNKIGRQKVPCVFHIIAAGRPDQVHNCTITNISMSSFSVKCTEGFNGGLTQSFLIEIKEAQTEEVTANFTSPIPRFAVSSLFPGHVYSVNVWAFNVKGRSNSVSLQVAMLRLPEKQLTAANERPKSLITFTPMISIIIGIVAAVLIGGLTVLLAVRISCRRTCCSVAKDNGHKDMNQRRNHTVCESSPSGSERSGESKEFDGNESDEKNPDVIPDTLESLDQKKFMQRRLPISTIENANSCRRPPNTAGLAGQSQANSTNGLAPCQPPNQQQPMAYCTLRKDTNSRLNFQTSVSINSVINTYNSNKTFTLPRHPPNQPRQWAPHDASGAPSPQPPPLCYSIPPTLPSGQAKLMVAASPIAMQTLRTNVYPPTLPLSLAPDSVGDAVDILKKESKV